MNMIEEFKKFALKGNVMDLAIGVVVGGAFGKITSSLVNNIIMPPLGILVSGVDFSKLKIVLQAATETHPEVSIGYGIFIQEIINFLIIALAMFFVVRALIRLQKKKEEAPAAPAAPPEDIMLLREIRDSLKK